MCRMSASAARSTHRQSAKCGDKAACSVPAGGGDDGTRISPPKAIDQIESADSDVSTKVVAGAANVARSAKSLVVSSESERRRLGGTGAGANKWPHHEAHHEVYRGPLVRVHHGPSAPPSMLQSRRLAEFYRLVASKTSVDVVLQTYRTLRALDAHHYLRRRDFRWMLRRAAPCTLVTADQMLQLLDDMYLSPGLRPAITDYQLVMWKAYAVDNWALAGDIWARMRSPNRPTGMMEDCIDAGGSRLVAILNAGDRRYLGPAWPVLLRPTAGTLQPIYCKAWAALVSEHAARGDMIALRNLLQRMAAKQIPLTPVAVADVLRRLIIADLPSTDQLISQLTDVPLRVHGWILEAYAVLGDQMRFLTALKRALKSGWQPEPSFFVPLLNSLLARTQSKPPVPPRRVSRASNWSKRAVTLARACPTACSASVVDACDAATGGNASAFVPGAPLAMSSGV
ncbi:hypothetical protein THASP1DRAFT_21869 [Thamnocephalis sphaerospora]|uniref:Uncharacterized protein n=1 Tax=Thamnocephalis sphaerospora TaxID=78915 RepID=A0A4P9XVW0_9FUNG|nr:hypothetical protein THASP1DRAFT_21869 [Thamnocephalis sphaerospora]|eukprot:RKP10425.1 hypothetical protein THASP1DRAFT_21869 [Thamnocephalis sphaerospora]